MSTAYRRAAPAIVDCLLAHPQRYNFFQAVSLLLLHLKEQGVALNKALVGHLRFENSLSLGFPASDVEAMRAEFEAAIAAAGAAVRASMDTRLRRAAVTPSFMGYLGLHGALPNHYTRSVADHQHATEGEGARAFLDLFQTRVVALFYEAWRKYRVEYTIGCEGDEFLPLLLSLTGMRARVQGQQDSAGGDNVDPALLGHYAGLLRQRPVSGSVLARVLTDYFCVPVAVREMVGYWDELAPEEQWRLDAPRMVLGEGTVLGQRLWRPDLRIGLSIGPLTRAQFDGFCPKTARSKALRQLLTVFGSLTLSYEVELMLHAPDVESVALAIPGAQPCSLGHGSFLMSRPGMADRIGMRFLIRLLAPLPPAGQHGQALP